MTAQAENTEREAAWEAVWEALPARWCVGLPSFDPGALGADGYRGAWSVTARGPHPGRGKAPRTVVGNGKDEAGALRDLDASLRGVRPANGLYLDDLRKRLRLAYLEGAEGWSRAESGQGLTPVELAGVLSRYRGM